MEYNNSERQCQPGITSTHNNDFPNYLNYLSVCGLDGYYSWNCIPFLSSPWKEVVNKLIHTSSSVHLARELRSLKIVSPVGNQHDGQGVMAVSIGGL